MKIKIHVKKLVDQINEQLKLDWNWNSEGCQSRSPPQNTHRGVKVSLGVNYASTRVVNLKSQLTVSCCQCHPESFSKVISQKRQKLCYAAKST